MKMKFFLIVVYIDNTKLNILNAKNHIQMAENVLLIISLKKWY